MSGVVKAVKNVVGGVTGSTAAKASSQAGAQAAAAATEASNIQAQAQREALQYLKEREAIPQQFREGALQQIAGLYGLAGGESGAEQALMSRAMSSPVYQAMTGGLDDFQARAIESGEEAILRQQAATGGLRSGNAQQALAGLSADIGLQVQNQQNQALLEAYKSQLGGLQGLASLPSNASQIAQTQAGIGQTLGQGVLSAGQAQAQGLVAGANARQQAMGGLIGLGGTLGAAAIMSDPRLKSDIKKIGEENGFNIYSWIWNEKANELGLVGESKGVMADEVEAVKPEAVSMNGDYKQVDYEMIGVSTHG